MNMFNFNEYRKLLSKKNDPSISIYIPTHRKGAEAEQDRIRYKNHLRDVEKNLYDKGIKKSEIDSLLKTSRELTEDVDFWNYREEGLAIFIAPGQFYRYRIPEVFEEKHYISARFYLRPLLTVLNGNERFLILTLNQKSIRLFESTRFTINEIKLKNFPVSIDDFLAEEVEDRTFQFHTLTAKHDRGGKKSMQGGQTSVFHEQGGGTDGKIHKEKIHEFFNMVDNGLQKYLSNERAPLLLSGIEYLLPIFREVSSYPYILEKTLPINTQDLNDADLRYSGWEIMKLKLERNLEDALKLYINYTNTVRATEKIEEIIRNSFNNRILYLFFNPDYQVWGRFNLNTYRVEVRKNPEERDEAQDIELIELAAEQTLLHNGVVFSVNGSRMPNGSQAAALFRY